MEVVVDLYVFGERVENGPLKGDVPDKLGSIEVELGAEVVEDRVLVVVNPRYSQRDAIEILSSDFGVLAGVRLNAPVNLLARK